MCFESQVKKFKTMYFLCVIRIKNIIYANKKFIWKLEFWHLIFYLNQGILLLESEDFITRIMIPFDSKND